MIGNQHKQVIWVLLLTLVVSPGFSQTFFLDDNGVTIKCVDCQPGDQGVVNGVTYTAVDNEMLFALKSPWQTTGGDGFIALPPEEDFESVCTTLVTNLDSMFFMPEFDIPAIFPTEMWNPDISTWDVSGVESMSSFMLQTAKVGMQPDLSHWDVGQVTDLSRAFQCSVFNGNISQWNTSSLTDLDFSFCRWGAFASCGGGSEKEPPNSFLWTCNYLNEDGYNFGVAGVFNGNISQWDVSNVESMTATFAGTTFNQPLNDWDVSNVASMSGMFLGSSFNQPLNDWDVSSVEYMSSMFGYTPFNQDVSSWDVSNVTSMRSMFKACTSFDQPLGSWDVSSVEWFNGMLARCYDFNQDLSSWDVSHAQDMTSLFNRCSSFNHDLSTWNVSGVEDMKYMFLGCQSFNQDLSAWDVSSVVEMSAMFDGCSSFNQPLNTWDVSNVIDMGSMFDGCSSFNQSLNSWDVSHVIDMSYMFEGCSSFNQDLCNWDLSEARDFESMFEGCTVFNGNITTWQFLENVDLNYENWLWMESMFNGCLAFNQPIGSWTVSAVLMMDLMFVGCTSFDQDLSSWCVPYMGDDYNGPPEGFSDGATQFQPSNWPQWGTCPDPGSSPDPLECILIQGCTDPLACNYDPAAVEDDQSCTYADLYFDCQGNCLNDADEDGVCDELEIAGCQYEWACNYNPEATEEDGSCTFPGQPCDDGDPNTTNDVLNADCDCVGETDEVSETWWDIQIYPSPSNGLLTLACPVPVQVDMTVMDMRGREVIPSKTLNLAEFNTMDMRHLRDGLYLLRIRRGNQVFIHQIVIQH